MKKSELDNHELNPYEPSRAIGRDSQGRTALQVTAVLLGGPLLGVLVAATNMVAFAIAWRMMGNPRIVPDMMSVAPLPILATNVFLGLLLSLFAISTVSRSGKGMWAGFVPLVVASAALCFTCISVYDLRHKVDGYTILNHWLIVAIGLYILAGMFLYFTSRTGASEGRRPGRHDR